MALGIYAMYIQCTDGIEISMSEVCCDIVYYFVTTDRG